MTYDLVIRGGRIVTAHDDFVGDVAVRDGRIVAIGFDFRGEREIDATGHYVLPGAIDGHVHMRTERAEFVYDDTFTTGTIAAAHGGVTCMVDQVQVEAGTALADGVAQRLGDADGQCVIDYGFHVNLREPSLERVAEIPALARDGFPSFKLFMNYETYALPDAIIFAALQKVADVDGVAVVHAEHRGVIEELDRQNIELDRRSRRWNARARPAVMEGEATHRALAMAHVAGARAVIFHMTCAEGVRELRYAQQRGQRAFGEVCPQYILLDESALDDPVRGTALDFSPPLRTEEHRRALWEGLGDGTIGVVSTDHGPRRRVRERDGSLSTPPGTSGIEVRLALMHTEGVLAGRVSLQRWVDACCTRPAEIFGLPRKGKVCPGYDADLVVFDPERRLTLSADVLHSDIDYSTYDGMTVQGLPVVTISRGEVIVENGELQVRPGRGALAERGFGTPSAADLARA